ncbi:MAG TPA: AraC family transcriptional regulator [Cytophagales bacterium]|nr:AraC family transcriptional regulator [Cytophagales bacterium]
MNDKIHIKNMVCPRCIEAVTAVLNTAGIPFVKVSLGEVQLHTPLDAHATAQLKQQLLDRGFDLLEDKKAKIVEKVKTLILQGITDYETYRTQKLSDYLSKQIGYDYSHISGIFSANQGITIEKFVILQKIERAKELLTYDELTLNEIADRLHYSSTAALSAQFKEVTGMTPTAFKKLRNPLRKPLDNVL